MMSCHHRKNISPLYLIILCYFLHCLPRCNSVILINEINANNPGTDTKEFIELYNTGGDQVSLDEYTLVLYNGRGNFAYAVVPLLTGVIPPHGFYVLGNALVPYDMLLTDIDGDGFDILQNGPDAIVLYHGDTSMFVNGMVVTNTSIVDAVVYDSTHRGRHDAGLTDVLTPGERTLHEFAGHIEGMDESISRCNGTDPRKLWQFHIAPITPGRENNCTFVPPTEPPATTERAYTAPLISEDLYPPIVINEFDIDTQFVELYDGGLGSTALEGLMLVFYSGTSSTAYANPIILNGLSTDDEGYFLIGLSESQPSPDVSLSITIATNGVNAIALHFEQPDNIVNGSPVTSRNMVDVVVYGRTSEAQNNYLVSVLSAGEAPLLEDGLSSTAAQGAVSLSRCRGWNRVMPQSFKTSSATPKADNVCELPEIVINEINAAAEEDALDEFIELFDGGLGRQSLDGIILVAYNGKNDAIYRSYDLTGYKTNSRGFAVLGYANHSFVNIPVETNAQSGFIQRGPDAVALYLGPEAKYRRGSPPTSNNLIDAIIYGTGDDPDLTLQHALLPLQSMPQELRGISNIDHSISRCACCQRLNASAFGVGPVTPMQINVDCTRNQTTLMETLDHYQGIIRINEVHLTRQGLMQGEYLELFDSGLGNIPLDDVVIAVYNGNGDDRSTALYSLNGYTTDSKGLFVIGSSYMTPTPQYSLTARTKLYPGSSGAVAIYKIPTGSMPIFVTQSVANREGLLDAVVFGDTDLTLVEALSPDKIPVPLATITDQISILRCFSHEANDPLAFAVNQSSPGALNTCPYPPVILNEVNVRNQGNDMGEYIELSSRGVPRFPLNNLQVVLWKGQTAKSYNVIKIDGGRTDENGYFLIGYQGLYAPRPDMTPFDQPNNEIRDGPNAITLHSTLSGTFRKNMPLNKTAYIDGLVFYIRPNQYPQNLIDFFTPDRNATMEDRAYSRRDESINRCEGSLGLDWVLAHTSAKAHNYCPSRNVSLVINEINLVASEQYIELWDNGAGFTSLDDFVIVLYGDDNLSYWNIPLAGYMTNPMGYFVMGVAGVRPLVQFPFADGFMRTQYGAIAVYKVSSSNSFLESTSPTYNGLIDAVVYSQNSTANPLSNALLSDSAPVQSDLLQTSHQTLSRCFSHDLLSTAAFAITRQTPKKLNDCPVLPTDVIINEINVEQPGDRSKEFIELYDGGAGNTPLRYLTLVLFNGHSNDKSYMTFDLDKYQTNEKGYFVIGSDRVRADAVDIAINTRTESQGVTAGLLQDGPDAIALYRAPAGAFPYHTRATPISLVDAIVYSTGDEDSHSLINKLLPGQSMVMENEAHLSADESISRCLGMQLRDMMVYTLGKPTPGRRNNCTGASAKFHTTVLISEINVETPGSTSKEFVELYDGGIGSTPLDGLILVFFNGANEDRSYLEVDLDDKSTSSTGYFIVGTMNVLPIPDIIIADKVIQNGPDAVALYHGARQGFLRGTIATPNNLIDTVVYGPSANQDSTLLAKLAPAQVQIHESSPGEATDWSLSKCVSNQTVSMLSFRSAPPTPGEANKCSQSRPAFQDNSKTNDVLKEVIINEIFYSDNYPSNTNSTIDYIELKGPANTPLSEYTFVIISITGYVVFSNQLINHQTYLDGIFTIATGNMVPAPDLGITSTGVILRETGAVALYRNAAPEYRVGSYMSMDGLVDALVYTDDILLLSNKVSYELMSDMVSFYSSDVSAQSQELSISRCTCCETRTSSVFTLAPPTLGEENEQCPSPDHGRVIKIRLLNGAYDIWNGNAGLIAELKGQIATGINGYCRCGFNVNYLTDDRILNGSVIYQTNMLAYNSNQSYLLYNSYVSYIQEVTTVSVHGVTYKVEGLDLGPQSGHHISGKANNKGLMELEFQVFSYKVEGLDLDPESGHHISGKPNNKGLMELEFQVFSYKVEGLDLDPESGHHISGKPNNKGLMELEFQVFSYKVEGLDLDPESGHHISVKPNNKDAVSIAVSVLVIVLVTGGIVVLVLLIRQRNLLQYLKNFNDSTHTADGEVQIPGRRCSFAHLNIFAQQFRADSFVNPVYMNNNDDGSSHATQGVTLATVPEELPVVKIDITDADVAKEPITISNDHKITELSKEDKVGNVSPVTDKTVKDDINKNETSENEGGTLDNVAIEVTGDINPILVGEKKKKRIARKDKSREKTSLDGVLKKLRQGEDSGSAEDKETDVKPKYSKF